jgi:hypothetical protein
MNDNFMGIGKMENIFIKKYSDKKPEESGEHNQDNNTDEKKQGYKNTLASLIKLKIDPNK